MHSLSFELRHVYVLLVFVTTFTNKLTRIVSLTRLSVHIWHSSHFFTVSVSSVFKWHYSNFSILCSFVQIWRYLPISFSCSFWSLSRLHRLCFTECCPNLCNFSLSQTFTLKYLQLFHLLVTLYNTRLCNNTFIDIQIYSSRGIEETYLHSHNLDDALSIVCRSWQCV